MTGPSSERTAGPTVYGTLIDKATGEGIQTLRSQIMARVEITASSLANELADIVRHAYMEGVRDGFVQGVAVNEHAAPSLTSAPALHGAASVGNDEEDGAA